MLNHVVVVAVVKRAVEQVGVRRKVPNELPWVLSPCGSVVAAVAVGVLEHEKVDIVPCPTVVEIEGPVQRRKAELGDDLHRSIEAARRRPVDRILNHCAANGINAPPGRRVRTLVNVCKDTVAVNVGTTDVVDGKAGWGAFTLVLEVVDAIKIGITLDRCTPHIVDIGGIDRRFWAEIKDIPGSVHVVHAIVVVVLILCGVLASIVVPIRGVVGGPVSDAFRTCVGPVQVVVVVIVLIFVKV